MTNQFSQMVNMAFSPSRRETLDCPFRFEKLYIPPKQTEPTSEMAEIGKMFHEWIAGYGKRCLEFETNRLRDLSWIKIFDSLRAGYPEPVQDKTRNMVQDRMDDLTWTMPFPENHGGLIDIEQKWGFQFHESSTGIEYLKPCGWFDKTIDLRMIADIVYHDGDVLNIVDHKTGWGNPWAKQLPWYAAGAYSRYYKESWSIMKIWYHWPAKGGYYEEVGFYNREDLPAVVADIICDVREARKTTEFPAKECRACSWCGFKSECPIVHDRAVILTDSDTLPIVAPTGGQFKIVDQGTAERALSAIVMVGGRLDELKKELQDYVKINGTISAGGQRMEQKDSEKWECRDMDGLLNALETDLDITVRDIIKTTGMSKSALLKVLRGARCGTELNDLLASFGDTKPVVNDPKIYKGE